MNNIPLILQNKDSNSRQYLDNFMVKNNVLLKPYLEVVSQDLILEFVNIGLGVGYTIKELVIKNYPNLKELKLEKSIPDITVYIATNKSIVLPFASNEFLNI